MDIVSWKVNSLEVTSDYLKIAEDIGYKTADLIWVQHTK
jgi:apolipoprotein D and lipocalin family protein